VLCPARALYRTFWKVQIQIASARVGATRNCKFSGILLLKCVVCSGKVGGSCIVIPAVDAVVIVTGVFRAVVVSLYDHGRACGTNINLGQAGYVGVCHACHIG